MKIPKIIIQFNEANFDLIEKYVKKYNLKHLKKILNFPNKIETTSETEYDNLEPWIQWYSFYTKKAFHEHKVFHLGDAIKYNHPTFLDNIDHLGIFGSMNIPRIDDAKIFIPDAWSELDSDNTFSSSSVYSAISQIINDNAKLKISFKSIIGLALLIGIPKTLRDIKVIINSIKSVAIKSRSELAALFDYFFLNYSLNRLIRDKLDLSLIFLNGFAHVQHHHLIDSEFIDGDNPIWYSKNIDHLKKTLIIYDMLFENLFSKIDKNYELWVITGLSQNPSKKPIFYWRFDNHQSFLSNFFDFKFNVFPRMTRDFEIKYYNAADERIIIDFLSNAKVIDRNGHHRAFGKIDKSYDSRVFSTFIYDGDSVNSNLQWKHKSISLKNTINFIAIKNGEHDAKGWAFNNGTKKNKTSIPIWNLSSLI